MADYGGVIRIAHRAKKESTGLFGGNRNLVSQGLLVEVKEKKKRKRR